MHLIGVMINYLSEYPVDVWEVTQEDLKDHLFYYEDDLKGEMKFKHGDMVEVEGYLGEVIKVTESYIEVLYGGEALHYCVEKYDINDARVVLSNNANHKKPNSD